MDDRIFKAIGKPLQRKEDRRLITGKGRFTDDFSLPGQTWAWMVRSPYPHARIVNIDKTEALAMPGVLAVLTGADCLADGLNPIQHNPVPVRRVPRNTSSRVPRPCGRGGKADGDRVAPTWR